MKREIRYYQQEAIDKTIQRWRSGVTKLLWALATGVGKTFTAVKFIERFKKEIESPSNFRVLWGTHEESLLEQSAIVLLSELELMPYNDLIDTIESNGGLIELLRNNKSGLFLDEKIKLITDNIGIIKADLFIIDKPIVIASMQTLWRRLDLINENHFTIIIADECHLFGAKSFKTSLDYFNPLIRLGLSATPYRTDGMLMGDIFDEIAYEYTIEQGIKDKFLCEIDAIRVKTNTNIDSVRTTAGELNSKDLEVVINTDERNQLIVDKYKEYALGRQFLAFCNDVQHTIDLCDKFNENGIKCNFVVGDKELTTDRKKIINEFKSGEYIGLTNCNVLVAGFDHPNIGCTLSTTPTKSQVKFLQGPIGRGTRLKTPDYVEKFGQNVIVLDFVDVTSRHRLINTWTLDKAKTLEEKTFITQQKRLELITKRDVKMRITSATKDEKVNLFKLPEVEISTSIRMQDPATPGQLKWIKDLGYDIENNNYTKEMCAVIISNSPAQNWQIKFLAANNYDVSQGATVGEYTKAKKIIEDKDLKKKQKEFLQKSKLPFKDLQ